MRCLIVALMVFLTVGCVSQEGIGIVSPDWGVEEIIDQRESRKESVDESIGDVPVDLVVIGNVSAFRPLTEKNGEEIYSEYLEFSKQLNPDKPVAYSAEEFRNEVAGWTKLKYFSIPLVYGHYKIALVPNGIHSEIQFPSGFGTIMVQVAGDLVAARTNNDGYYFVRQVLCKDGQGYSTCAKNYHKGFFDGSTGEEIDRKTLTPKDSGERIDPVNYKKIEP